MNIIIDTNLWISFAIGKRLAAMQSLLTNPAVKIYVCDELLDEFAQVSARPKMREHITDDDVRDTYGLMEQFCHHALIRNKAVSPIRDSKDVWLLSLAETISADFILTGDKDLLALQRHAKTRIATYAEFATFITDESKPKGIREHQ